jgi:hypothetical protein
MRKTPEGGGDEHARGLDWLDLIQESSRDNVLSELEPGATSRTGDLLATFETLGCEDRDRDDA